MEIFYEEEKIKNHTKNWHSCLENNWFICVILHFPKTYYSKICLQNVQIVLLLLLFNVFFLLYYHNNLKWIKQLAECLRSGCFMVKLTSNSAATSFAKDLLWTFQWQVTKSSCLSVFWCWVTSRELGKEKKKKKTRWPRLLFVSTLHVRFLPDVHISSCLNKSLSYLRMSISFNSKSNIITLFNKCLTRDRHFSTYRELTRVYLLAI